jgi:hypothetical protein
MTRQEAVASLVSFDKPLALLRAGVAAFPYDWDGPALATLRSGHVASVLARWKSGNLTAEEVEEWANLVEIREDLTHDPDDLKVADAVFDLANPLLQGDLTEIGPALLKAMGS